MTTHTLTLNMNIRKFIEKLPMKSTFYFDILAHAYSFVIVVIFLFIHAALGQYKNIHVPLNLFIKSYTHISIFIDQKHNTKIAIMSFKKLIFI